VPFACAPIDGLAAPTAKRRSTPRFGRRSWSDALLLQPPPPTGSSHPRWIRCCAGPQRCEPSLPQQRHWGGGGPVGDVRPRRVAAVQLCMSLQKVLRLSNGVNEDIFNKKEVEYSLVWEDFVRRIMLARMARRPRPAAPAKLAGARLHWTTPLHTCERDQWGRCTRNPSDNAAGLVGRGVCKMRT
jgi:hypothetical protein